MWLLATANGEGRYNKKDLDNDKLFCSSVPHFPTWLIFNGKMRDRKIVDYQSTTDPSSAS
jgi:hypothetical protein